MQVEGEPPRFAYSYSVFWLKTARAWPAQKRQAITAALQRVLGARDFVPTATAKRFTVDGLDEPYSGASLLALSKVLAALEAEDGRA